MNKEQRKYLIDKKDHYERSKKLDYILLTSYTIALLVFLVLFPLFSIVLIVLIVFTMLSIRDNKKKIEETNFKLLESK